MAGAGDETSGAAAAGRDPRASQTDREHVVDLLKAAFVQGRLTQDELDERVGQALASQTYGELTALTADLHPALTRVKVACKPAARRRSGWAAAALAVVLLAFLGVAVSIRAPGPGHAVSTVSGSGAFPGSGAPRYYVQQSSSQIPRLVAAVRATATGTVTATVRCPGQQAPIGDIVAASVQNFFMVCQQVAGKGASAVVTGSRIYQFHVTGSGRVSGYSLVPGGALPGLQTYGLAASADGSEVAVTASRGAAAARSPEGAEIMVINAQTGARAVWHNSPAVPGKMTFGIAGMSFTANGHELAFLGIPRCVRGPCTPTGNGEEIRAVSPAAQGGNLSSSRLLIRQSALVPLATGYIDGAVISPDGSSVAVLEMNTPSGGSPDNTMSVVQVSATTGKPLRVRYQVNTGNGFFFRFFGADPSGRYLLLNAGPTSGKVNGWIYQGRLIKLTPANGDSVFYEAW
jgi:Domain of unknown function (DUF1707)